MNDRIDRVLLQYKVDEAALQQAQVGTEDFRGDLASLATTGKDAFGNLAQDANASLGALRASLNNTTVTLDDLRGDLADTADAASSVATDASEEALVTSGKLAGVGREVSGALNEVVPGLGRMTSALMSMDPISIAAAAGIALLSAAFGDMQKAAEKAKKAAEEAAAADIKGVDIQTRLDQELALAQGGNSAARQKIIDEYKSALNDEQSANNQHLEAQAKYNDALKRYNDAQEIILNPDKYSADQYTAANNARRQAQLDMDAYTTQVEKTGTALKDAEQKTGIYFNGIQKLGLSQQELDAALRGDVPGLQKAQEQADTFMQGLVKGGENLVKGVEKVADAVKKHLDDLAKAEAEAKAKQAADIANSVKKYNADVQSINDKFYADEARLEQKAADDQIKIIQRAADESAKALQQLEDTRAKDILAAQRGETDAQTKLRDKEADDVLKAQRQEAQDLATHLQRIRDIQQKAQDSEFEQGLDRDFAGLARTRRQTAQQIRDENQNFVSQQAQKRQQLAQTLTDDRTAYDRERQQRILNLQRQLDDANSAYTAQLKQLITKRDVDLKIAQQADAAELQQARAKYTKELQLRQQAEVAELNLLRMSAEARLKLEADLQAALIAQSYAIMAHAVSGQAAGGGSSSAKATSRAFGGDLGIGQLAKVNDGGRQERFNGSAFPNVKGLFIPLESGRVDSGKGSSSITINQSIQGGNNASPEAIAQISVQQITKALKRLYA